MRVRPRDGGIASQMLQQTSRVYGIRFGTISTLASRSVGPGPTCRQNFSGMRVEYNRIYSIGNGVLSDLAAIYAVGPLPGSIFDHNLVYNVSCGGNGAHAFYIDQACSATTWSNNVAYDIESSVFHVNYGLNNLIINNIFFAGSYVSPNGSWPCSYPPDCLPVGLLSNKAGPGNGEQSVSSLAFIRNILLLTTANATAPFQTLASQGLLNCSFDLNTYFSLSVGPAMLQFPPSESPTSFAQWQAGGEDGLSVTADPLFADPFSGNFTLLPGSPSLALGFQPIDVSSVGPRPGRAYGGYGREISTINHPTLQHV